MTQDPARSVRDAEWLAHRFDPAGDTTLRLLSIFRPSGTDPDAAWIWVTGIDYSAALPY